MPRRSAAESAGTREAIIERAVAVASVNGLEGLTIGRLALDLDMSKSGLIGHFGSKEALQLAALDAAVEVFRREVWEPAAGAEPGLPRLRAICAAWLDYLERDVFPGGCFLTAAATEFDGREGAVCQATRAAWARWLGVLESDARVALEGGELPADTDPAAVAFELNSIAIGLNHARQLHGDPDAVRHARSAMQRLLHG